MFEDKNKGKIIIQIEKDNDKINSNLDCRGIAKSPEIALTTLLINFVSLSIEKGKSPEELIEKHMPGMIKAIESGKKI
jgi:hypothetical protein